ncbi:membrane protein [Leuconostoc gelidum subsp. gasicomitatum]|uniref:YczE/YyaS/YitT family protein n=1 Tax=Leuconostoc gasicomitatum TaxID=115778 RepID=UPI001CC6C799|nr:membrane protein [Leuconostoc gasicomitatum]MBZ5984094.1 membrane protein [Leuconostoc gasicomitatum]
MFNKKLGVFSLRLGLSIVGTVIIAFGIVLFRLANIGIDPATAADVGISDTCHWNLGNYQLAFNALLFLGVLFFDKTQFGIGTLINMSLPGYIVAYFTPKLAPITMYWFGDFSYFENIFLFIIGMLLFSLGIGIYTNVNLGVSPYDAIAPLFSKKKWASYRLTRSVQDLLFFVLAIIFGGPLGIGTFLIATLTGYIVQYWRQLFKKIKRNI